MLIQLMYYYPYFKNNKLKIDYLNKGLPKELTIIKFKKIINNF